MKLQKSQWPNTAEAECTRTFAERVLELTDHYSNDSYRHRTLSTSNKAFELAKWAMSVRQGLVPKPTLFEMIDEYIESLKDDPIIDEICEHDGIPRSSLMVSRTDSIEKMLASFKLYRDLIFPKYEDAAKRAIIQAALLGKKGKIKIVKLAEYYIPHILLTERSREIVHISAKREFFLAPGETSSQDRIRGFYHEVEPQQRSFQILIKCHKDLAGYLSTLLNSEIQEHRELPAHFRATVKPTRDSFLQRRFEGTDPFMAARSMKLVTDILKSFSFIYPQKSEKSTIFAIYSFDPVSGAVYRVEPDEFLNMGSAVRDPRARTRSIKTLARFALGSQNEKEEQAPEIFDALLTATSASQISDTNARLASLWSAFEALLPTPMKDGVKSTRITHFAGMITPLASFTYSRDIFYGMYADLSREDFCAQFYSFVDQHGCGDNRFEKFLSVFFLSTKKKREFIKIFSASPLLMLRAHNLDLIANDPERLRHTIDCHKMRVYWQIHRIYRARNDIMHNADSPPFSRPLFENATSYFKSLVLTLLSASDRYRLREVHSLVELCIALQNEHDEQISRLSAKAPREALFHAVRGPIP